MEETVMSALNGNNNGKRTSLLARIFGLGVSAGNEADNTFVMTSDGSASVNLEQLIGDPAFEQSANDLSAFLDRNIPRTPDSGNTPKSPEHH
jgi:hypothetical protein